MSTRPDPVTGFCNSVMRAVANGFTNRRDILEARMNGAVEVMREEIKAFFDVKNPKFESERQCVMRSSLHDGVIVASVAAVCIERILALPLES